MITEKLISVEKIITILLTPSVFLVAGRSAPPLAVIVSMSAPSLRVIISFRTFHYWTNKQK
jgi:hypothetical protein